jgi:hypothetical protein
MVEKLGKENERLKSGGDVAVGRTHVLRQSKMSGAPSSGEEKDSGSLRKGKRNLSNSSIKKDEEGTINPSPLKVKRPVSGLSDYKSSAKKIAAQSIKMIKILSPDKSRKDDNKNLQKTFGDPHDVLNRKP